ncbi:MAG: protein-glutamate O-methyltransferase CheR [Myxococcales bacterium]|nr:protein-glutamate O-methyltransferase CheR [Myxococcales bacterium]
MVTTNALPTEMLRRIRSSISQRTGLAPQDWVLEARVRQRMRATGIEKVEHYSATLAGRAELTALVELLRVGETRFFRHESHMRALTEMVLPAMRNTTGPARIWSAGCATGEEAYTLAMLFSLGLDSRRSVNILASDISPSSLRSARLGIYRESALGSMPEIHRSDLEAVAEGRYQVAEHLRGLVEFEERNLATGPFPDAFDLVFCRNVLIYFEEETKDAALRKLVKALKPGAFLFLGYSESLRDVAGLEVVSSGECRAYRKQVSLAAKTVRNTPPPQTPTPATATATAMPATEPSSTFSAFRLTLRGEYRDGIRLSEELDTALRSANGLVSIDLDGADFLGHGTAEVLLAKRTEAKALGISLSWHATRSGHLRFLRRHNLHSEGGSK